MSRTSNPYEAGEIAHPAQRDAATAWADGYRAYRNGESRTNADLAYDTWLLRAAWSEGWYASRADVRAEFDTGRPAKRAGDDASGKGDGDGVATAFMGGEMNLIDLVEQAHAVVRVYEAGRLVDVVPVKYPEMWEEVRYALDDEELRA